MDRAIAREHSLSRLLTTYIVTGVIFMLLPGTFLGVWNLIKISSREAAESISPAWIQAHGHAQLFGWVGTFILGIGFYSIPKLRKLKPFALWEAWTCWGLWTIGVLIRWLSTIYPWHWRVLVPLSAVMELVAFLIFFGAVASHRSAARTPKPWEAWIFVVITASLGLLASLVLNLSACIQLALSSNSPAFPHEFDQSYLLVSTWGFLVPMVWSFSSRWLTVFMGLRPLRNVLLLVALSLNTAGVLAGFIEHFFVAGVLLLAGAVTAIAAIRFFEPAAKAAKTINVHRSFPVFIRMAYGWLLIAAALGICASLMNEAPGLWGASRHALTVGFIAAMIFCVGQRVLPSFCGMRILWSTRLMLVMLVLLMTGCTLRVVSELLAYQDYARWAWNVLPGSALIELTAVALFAINLIMTFARLPMVFWIACPAFQGANMGSCVHAPKTEAATASSSVELEMASSQEFRNRSSLRQPWQTDVLGWPARTDESCLIPPGPLTVFGLFSQVRSLETESSLFNIKLRAPLRQTQFPAFDLRPSSWQQLSVLVKSCFEFPIHQGIQSRPRQPSRRLRATAPLPGFGR